MTERELTRYWKLWHERAAALLAGEPFEHEPRFIALTEKLVAHNEKSAEEARLMLTQSQTVLRRTNIADRAYFASEEEPQSADVALRLDLWSDMGEPEQITVTIEPGDLLNA